MSEVSSHAFGLRSFIRHFSEGLNSNERAARSEEQGLHLPFIYRSEGRNVIRPLRGRYTPETVGILSPHSLVPRPHIQTVRVGKKGQDVRKTRGEYGHLSGVWGLTRIVWRSLASASFRLLPSDLCTHPVTSPDNA